MIKVSIFYPYVEGGRFDMDYYLNTHMPLSISLLSTHAGYRGVSVERGLGGGAPDTPPSYLVMCHFLFDSLEEFVAAFETHRPTLRADVPNYTDLQSTIQISEIAMSQSVD